MKAKKDFQTKITLFEVLQDVLNHTSSYKLITQKFNQKVALGGNLRDQVHIKIKRQQKFDGKGQLNESCS